jgi:hypothetical protein
MVKQKVESDGMFGKQRSLGKKWVYKKGFAKTKPFAYPHMRKHSKFMLKLPPSYWRVNDERLST